MSLYDQAMSQLPEQYYPTMYMDGFTPEQIMMTRRRDMLAEYAAQAEQQPMDVNIRTEMHQK